MEARVIAGWWPEDNTGSNDGRCGFLKPAGSIHIISLSK
jgi:hypothetical protein